MRGSLLWRPPLFNFPMNDSNPENPPEIVPVATPQIDTRRRLRELLSVPERDRTDEQWDEIIELEIQLAPGNRISGNESQGGGNQGRNPMSHGKPGGGGGGAAGGGGGGEAGGAAEADAGAGAAVAAGADLPDAVTIDGMTLSRSDLVGAATAVAERLAGFVEQCGSARTRPGDIGRAGLPVVAVLATPTPATVLGIVGALIAGVPVVPVPEIGRAHV